MSEQSNGTAKELDALIRQRCDCRTPQETGTRSGYTCPEHRLLHLLTMERNRLLAVNEALRTACREAHRFVSMFENSRADALERVLWSALNPDVVAARSER